jgi:phosphatidylglycerophosphate synthase
VQPTLLEKLEHGLGLKDEETLRRLRKSVPSAVTALRLGLVLPLVFLVINDQYFFGAVLFLFLLTTDYLDGFLARKLGVSSRFGTYFDATTDFVFVLCMFAAFIPKGFCADWIPIAIIVVFTEFMLTGVFLNETYDPVGKYYGSLLYAAIGLRFLLSGQFFYDVVTVGVTAFAVASILSRATYILKKQASN